MLGRSFAKVAARREHSAVMINSLFFMATIPTKPVKNPKILFAQKKWADCAIGVWKYHRISITLTERIISHEV